MFLRASAAWTCTGYLLTLISIVFSKFSAALIAVSFAGAGVALGQDPLKAYPNNYKLIFDNADVSVIRVHYGPHEKVGVHDHSKFPTIYVYLNDAGPVRFSHDEKPPFVLTRPAVKAGSFRVSPGRVERHTVENLSDGSSEYLRIELKRIPLHGGLRAYRGAAPATLASGTREEYAGREVSIERIVCDPGAACAAKSSGTPVLLVAFSPIKVAVGSRASLAKTLQGGEVEWLPKADGVSIAAATQGAAHLLEIKFHRPPM